MTDLQFLKWLAERLVTQYGESPNVDFVLRLQKIISAGKGVGYAIAYPEPILDTDDAATVITKLRLTVQLQAGELDRAKKWGEAMAQRWRIVYDALQASSKVEQAP